MNIKEILNTNIRGVPTIVPPLKLLMGTIYDQNNHHLLDIRGWGRLQHADNNRGEEIQDSIALWVLDTLNKELLDISNNKRCDHIFTFPKIPQNGECYTDVVCSECGKTEPVGKFISNNKK